MTHYLITGASGFLGRHVIQAITASNSEANMTALVRDPAQWTAMPWTQAFKQAQALQGELLLSDWHQATQISELNGIFHLAALVRHSRRNSEEVYQTNLNGTLKMVELAAEKNCRMVYISTSGTVGVFNSRHEWADEHANLRERQVLKWPYYHSKLKAERAARALADKLGVELIIIRPPILLGPGDHRFRSTGHIIRYLSGKLPFLIDGGMHFIDIRDAAQALYVAMNHPDPRPLYHLSGVACSIKAFFDMVEKASGVKGPAFSLPHPIALTLARMSEAVFHALPGDTHSPLPDPVVIEMAAKFWDTRSRYAKEDLGFLNRHGQETIQDTVDWLYQNHPKLKSVTA